jgi:hypothetical protein
MAGFFIDNSKIFDFQKAKRLKQTLIHEKPLPKKPRKAQNVQANAKTKRKAVV